MLKHSSLILLFGDVMIEVAVTLAGFVMSATIFTLKGHSADEDSLIYNVYATIMWLMSAGVSFLLGDMITVVPGVFFLIMVFFEIGGLIYKTREPVKRTMVMSGMYTGGEHGGNR